METTDVTKLSTATKIEVVFNNVKNTGRKFITGFYFNKDLQSPKSGYMIAIESSPEITNPTKSELTDLYKKLGVNEYIGGWYYKGNCIVDISELVQDYDEAMMLGKQRKEIAIYDVVNNKSIKIQ